MIEDDIDYEDYDEYYYEDYEPPFPQYEDDDYEPEIDVCQGCGCYFKCNGVIRQKVIQRLKIVDGASSQRCWQCLEN